MALKDLLTEEDFQSIYLQSFPLHEEFNYGAGPIISTGLNKSKDSVLNFKAIPFGKDQPKGGNSRQPYIISNIPEGTENYAFKPYALFGDSEVGLTSGGEGVLETINSVSSGLIRGGAISAGIHSATDALRLAQFGIDLEKGIPFIAKQVGLQLSNVKMEAPSKSASLLNNNRIYNLGVNTIAQAGVNAFGLHFRRHGLLPSPSEGQNDDTGYYKLATRNNLANDNRLVTLLDQQSKSDQKDLLPGKKEFFNELYSYSGGPKSVYGIGKTTIRSYVNTLNQDIFFNEDSELGTPKLYNYLSLDQPSSQAQKAGNNEGPSIGNNGKVYLNKLSDFRRLKADKSTGGLGASYNKVSSDYGLLNMERRLGIGTGYDEFNNLGIIRAVSKEDKSNPQTKDLVKFFIEAVNNDNPEESDYIFFRAFIDRFTDNYSSKWKKYNFVGNPEPFFNYDSFDRDINISFKVIIFRQEEQRSVYTRLNALISQLMPDYKSGNTRARAPYIKLTLGDYLNRVPGFISQLSIDPVQEAAWEINLYDDETIQSLPQALNVNLKFQPIHNFVPKKVTKNDTDVPFITLNSRVKDGLSNTQYIIGGESKDGIPLDSYSRDIESDLKITQETINKSLEEEAERAEEISLTSQFGSGVEVNTSPFGQEVGGIDPNSKDNPFNF